MRAQRERRREGGRPHRGPAVKGRVARIMQMREWEEAVETASAKALGARLRVREEASVAGESGRQDGDNGAGGAGQTTPGLEARARTLALPR